MDEREIEQGFYAGFNQKGDLEAFYKRKVIVGEGKVIGRAYIPVGTFVPVEMGVLPEKSSKDRESKIKKSLANPDKNKISVKEFTRDRDEALDELYRVVRRWGDFIPYRGACFPGHKGLSDEDLFYMGYS